MKGRKKTRGLALLLCSAMVLTLAPTTASAQAQERNRSSMVTHQYDELVYDALKNGEYVDVVDIWGNNTKAISLSDAKYGLTGDNYSNVTNHVRFTNPDIVGIETVYQKYRLNGNYTTILGYYAQMYDEDGSVRAQLAQKLPEVMKEVYARIPQGASDFEKVHIVHDYLISCSAYNQYNLLNDVFEGTDHDAAGVFLKHTGMCQGYSLAFKYVMDQLGIEAGVVISGTANHAWNVVKLGNDWYHVDLTGDDKGYDILGRCEHTYLCLSTASLLALDSARSDFIVYLDNYNQSFNDDTCGVSTTYENAAVEGELAYSLNSYSPCIYYGNGVYTVNSENNIVRYDKETGEWSDFAQIPLMESVWHPYGNDGANYTNLVPQFAVLAYAGGNTAYINSTKHIYQVNLDTGAMQEIYTMNADYWYSISGIAIVEDELRCEVTDVAGEKNAEWIKVADVELPEIDIPEEPPVPVMTLVDPVTGADVNVVSVAGIVGGRASVAVKNAGASVSVTSDNTGVATASYQNSNVAIQFVGAGSTAINLGENLVINVEVSKAYSDVKEITLTEGESTTLTFDGVNIKADVVTSMTDAAVAKVTAIDANKPGTEGTPATTTKVSSFKTGSYVLGYESGSTKSYLVNNSGTLGVTDDPAKASVWTLSGSSSTCYLQNGSYYLNRSTSGISLSTSKVSWKYSSGRFYFQQSSGFFSKKSYYLVYSGGKFTVTTSTSSSAAMYTVKAGTAAVPGEKYSTVTIVAAGRGNTTFEIADVLYKVSVLKKAGTIVLKVNIVDDLGNTLKNSYEISGLEETAYEVKPDAIYGYITPGNITGTFSEDSTADITLVYVLNTDKSALQTAITGKVAKGNYTDASYSAYEAKISAGQSVLNNSRATQSEVDSALQAINSAKSALTIKQKTITVNIVDDAGVTLKSSYQISGSYGTAYTVTPDAIAGYKTPQSISGTYGENSTDITLVYVLNTDKSALQAAITGKVAKGNYTDASYSAYEAQITAGQAVLDNARATQSEVDSTLQAINSAKAALTEKVVATGLALDSDGVDSGSSYIIVDNGYALSGLSALAVTVNSGYLTDPKNTNAVWKITKTTLGYTIYNETTGKYLGYKASGVGSKRTCAPMLSSSKKYFKVSQSGTGIQLYATSTYNFYLTCQNGKFTMTRTADTVDIYKVK